MKIIDKVIRKFKGRQCPLCRSSIVETFKAKEFGETPPGFFFLLPVASSRISSVGIGCMKCGLQFGEPIFSSMLTNAEIEKELCHELSFNEYSIKAAIQQSDLPFREDDVPQELASLGEGDEVYVKKNEAENRRLTGYTSFYLSNKIGAKEYIASSDCFE